MRVLIVLLTLAIFASVAPLGAQEKAPAAKPSTNAAPKARRSATAAPAKAKEKAADKKEGDKDEEPVLARKTIDYKEGETALEGYLAYDPAETKNKSGKSVKLPGVLIVHQWKGLGDHEKRRARQLAELGYAAFAVDVYGTGIRPATPEEAGKQAGVYKNDRALLRKRLHAALETLKAQSMVDPDKIAAIGYCFGGLGVLEMARAGEPLAGVVSFHGALDAATPAKAGEVKAKVLVLHGAEDPHVPAEQVAAFQQEMRDAAADWQFVAFGGAVHSFTDKNAGTDPTTGVAYDEAADKRSWNMMRDFFKEIFKDDKDDAKPAAKK